MDRYEYLGTLKYYLRGISEKESNQIIEEFKSHFVEAEMSGQTDEETAESLGDPKAIAAEILEEYDVKEDRQTSEPQGNGFGGFISNLVDKITQSAVVIDLSSKKEDKDITAEVVRSEAVITDHFSNVDLRTKLSDVTVKTHDRDDVIIESKKDPHLVYKIQNDTLEITEKSKKEGGFIGKFTNSDSKSVVYLPKKHYGSFEMRTSVGALKIDEISANEVTLNSSVGELKVRKLETDTLTVKAATGEVKVSDVTAKHVKASIATGDLDLIGLNPDANIEISVSLGDATIKYRTVPTDVTVDITENMGSVKTNGLFEKKGAIGTGTTTIKGKVSMGDLKFKI
ncbi:hypothetical protein GCM10007358_17880 [Phocicoccus schoeneichii]|uniref:DUF4097 domain-containing protein n=1 Tax=Phocicoccus schoeneichii TaxID=1812261 RepID=A0A6V7RDQ1_9BACL|nr:DUF4097 family beta strand repeat-containing protein [Jeotgalicoccus schoeneichii]GGH56005.1 hypothetical protein GCM10007358_17880 [Jeotgalicoccus schoeneichii]CAD2075170.1 hypothetical protein JEOSCH030_00814 [Jeotgalicoccus schoeneichii]